MPPIVIYTKSTCSYCRAAKDLLRRKGAAFEEISVDGDRAGQAAMAVKAGGRSTVPQIFVGATHVGRLRRSLRPGKRRGTRRAAGGMSR